MSGALPSRQAPDQARPRSAAVRAGVTRLASAPGDARGAVFTAPHVVAHMLDAVGYTEDRDLTACRILEPSFGDGAFLAEIARRLVSSARRHHGSHALAERLAGRVRGVEVSARCAEQAKERLREVLGGHCRPAEAEEIISGWLTQDDFLLADLGGCFTQVVGNPPYVRYDSVDPDLMDEYKARFPRTMRGRVDLYVPFFEKTLGHLAADGVHSFICSDRWMKNGYGGGLRELIDESFHLVQFSDARHISPFVNAAAAYTAITVIRRRAPGSGAPVTRGVRLALRGASLEQAGQWQAVRHLGAKRRGEPFVIATPEEMAVLRRLETFPVLEDAGCKVRIGVASGCDAVYILQGRRDDVEADRLLPLAMAADVQGAKVADSDRWLVNPYDAAGNLVDLGDYPKLNAYFERHGQQLRARHVARKKPEHWYKTIDKVSPGITGARKLLIPDMKGRAAAAIDDGRFYPHHNLYFMTSDGDGWPLEALRFIILSDVTNFFISHYSTPVAGGCLRFQAVCLRRLRLPPWHSLQESRKAEILSAIRACGTDCREKADAVASLAYGLSKTERKTISGRVG